MPVFLLRRTQAKNLERLNSAVFEKEIRDAQVRLGEFAQHMYQLTVKSWASRPEFFIHYVNYNMQIGTGDMIYNFLDFGTSVRYAVMSNPYYPKTHPHFVGSTGGMGKAVIRGYAAGAQPGIEARSWSADITAYIKPKFQSDMANAIRRGIRRMGKGT